MAIEDNDVQNQGVQAAPVTDSAQTLTQDVAPVADPTPATPAIVMPTAAERAKMSKEDLAKLKTDLAAVAQAALTEVEQDILAEEEKVTRDRLS